MSGTSTLSTMVTVRMLNEVHAALLKIAQRDGRPMGSIVNEAAAEYVRRDAQALKRAGKRSRKQRLEA
jgi:hypothetical protein